MARPAIDVFVARLVEEIARLAATMGGLYAIVSCGGIWESYTEFREQVGAATSLLSPCEAEILVRRS